MFHTLLNHLQSVLLQSVAGTGVQGHPGYKQNRLNWYFVLIFALELLYFEAGFATACIGPVCVFPLLQLGANRLTIEMGMKYAG